MPRPRKKPVSPRTIRITPPDFLADMAQMLKQGIPRSQIEMKLSKKYGRSMLSVQNHLRRKFPAKKTKTPQEIDSRLKQIMEKYDMPEKRQQGQKSMRQRKWNRFSVGRAAVLAREGATRERIVQHYLKHYGQKWGIRTEQEMEQALFKPKRGAVAVSPGKMFFGKEPAQIKKTYEKWKAKSQQARQRMAQAHEGKKRGPLTPETRAKMSTAKKGIKRGPLISQIKKEHWKQWKENSLAAARKQAIEKLYKNNPEYGQLLAEYTRKPENKLLETILEKIISQQIAKQKQKNQ